MTLTEEQIHTIVECAQSASTSSYIQPYSIIGVSDPKKKANLAELAGEQTYVEKSGQVFVFCADLHRHDIVAQMECQDLAESIESTEKFMVALLIPLLRQNAAIAA